MPYKDKEKKREHNRRLYASHKELGICIKCKSPAAEGHTKCQKHLLNHNMYTRRNRQKHRELGLCQKCSSPAVGGVYCAEHWYLHQRKMREYCNRNSEVLKNKNYERYKRMMEEGRCRDCGVKLIEGEWIMCMGCRCLHYER